MSNQLNVSDGGSDRRQLSKQRVSENVQQRTSRCGGGSTPTRRPKDEIRTANSVRKSQQSEIQTANVWIQNRRKSVDILVDVDEDNLKSCQNLCQTMTRLIASALSQQVRSTFSSRACFYTQNFCCVVEPPPLGGGGGGRKLFLRETCKNAIKKLK